MKWLTQSQMTKLLPGLGNAARQNNKARLQLCTSENNSYSGRQVAFMLTKIYAEFEYRTAWKYSTTFFNAPLNGPNLIGWRGTS